MLETIEYFCDVCNTSMSEKKEDGNYEHFIGASFELYDTTENKKHKEFLRVLSTFGKTNFFLCWVCMLKSSGFKTEA